jgi:hypothetical protein
VRHWVTIMQQGEVEVNGLKLPLGLTRALATLGSFFACDAAA